MNWRVFSPLSSTVPLTGCFSSSTATVGDKPHSPIFPTCMLRSLHRRALDRLTSPDATPEVVICFRNFLNKVRMTQEGDRLVLSPIGS